MFTFLLAMLVASPVKVTGGMVAGVPGADSSIIAFKAIPFAAPPVGSLRWGAIAEAGSPEKLSFFERSLMAPPPPQRQVAVTIDDLPVGQAGRSGCRSEASSAMTDRLLKPVREEHIPVTAFVIANNCATLTVDERRDLLKKWIDAGAELGNHTWSHPDLNTMPIAEYEQDILRGDAWLRSAMDLPKVRFVRSPMLHTGPDEAAKRRLERFLAEHDWRQAVVTLDNSDWMFAFVLNDALLRKDDALAARVREEYLPYMESVVVWFEKRSVEVVGREFPQVLLIHANQLNSEKLPELLAMFNRRGYRFISLEEAMKDPAYSLPDGYAGKGGFSWIHRWSMAKKMAPVGEPDEPAWLREAYAKVTR